MRTRHFLTGLITLSCGLLSACQFFSANQSLEGVLSLAVEFPPPGTFHTQNILPETRAIYVMVHGKGLPLDKPAFWGPLTRLNPRMMVKGVPIGPQNVVVAAYDQQRRLISAAHEEVIVQGGVRTALTADLQPEPASHLSAEELRALSLLQPEIPPEPCGFATQSLQFTLDFQAFQTQLIKPETQAVYLVVYGTGLPLEKPAVFGPLSPANPHVTASQLPVGAQVVMTVAVDAAGKFLTGARQEVEIKANQRLALNQELREGFEGDLKPEELDFLKKLTLPQLQKLAELTVEIPQPVCPTPSPVATPSVLASPLPRITPSPEPTPTPLPTPTPTPLPTPVPTPLASPALAASNPSSSSSSSSSGPVQPTPTPTPTGANLNLDLTINNGTVGIPPVTAF